MAATAYTVQVVPHAGLAVTYVIPTQNGGHTAPTGADIALIVKNGSGAPINLDVHVPGTIDTLPVATPAAALAPSRRVVCTNAIDEIIPLPPELYADPVTGLATFDVSAFATISIACVRIA
jgi:hypothetical protein